MRAALDARLALRRAAAACTQPPPRPGTPPPQRPPGRRAPGGRERATWPPAGTCWRPTSPAGLPARQPAPPWAAVITSPPVAAALLDELGCLLPAAGSLDRAAIPDLPVRGPARRRHRGTPRQPARWLRIAGTASRPRASRSPPRPNAGCCCHTRLRHPAAPAAAGRKQKRSPNCARASRSRPTGSATRPARSPARPAGPPPPSRLSWRRGSLAAAITGHASELILRGLTERARQLRTCPAIHAQLASASDAIRNAWPAWRMTARHWDTVTHRHPPWPGHLPVAAELDDLVLRTGRLAYRKPRLDTRLRRRQPHPRPGRPRRHRPRPQRRAGRRSPRRRRHQPRRRPATPTPSAEPPTATALYLPTRLLPTTTTSRAATLPRLPRMPPNCSAATTPPPPPHGAPPPPWTSSPSAPAPPAARSPLPGSHPARRSLCAGPAGDDRNRALALPAPPPGTVPPHPGQIEDILRSLHITEPGMLLCAAAIDDAARDVLAHATASSRNRDSISQPPPQRKPGTPGDGARTAANRRHAWRCRHAAPRHTRGPCQWHASQPPTPKALAELASALRGDPKKLHPQLPRQPVEHDAPPTLNTSDTGNVFLEATAS